MVVFDAVRKAEMYQFFSVAFGAVPGTTYWGQLQEAVEWGMSTLDIVKAFTSKAQFLSTYPLSLSHQDFATRLIENVVKSSATAPAKMMAYSQVVEALEFGLSRGEVIYNVFSNLANRETDPTQPGYDAADPFVGVAKQLANQVKVAQYYTEVLKADSALLSTLQAVLRNVTDQSDVSSTAKLQAIVDSALGTSPSLVLYGSDQPQTLTGGAGDDVFILVGTTAAGQYAGSDAQFADLKVLNARATSQVQAGESYDGGGGNNTLHLYGTVDLSGVTLKNFNKVVLHSDATFSAAQMAQFNAAAATIMGDGASALRLVQGFSAGPATVDMTRVTLQAIGQFDLAQSLTVQLDQFLGLDNIGTLSVGADALVEGAASAGLDFSALQVYGAGSLRDGLRGNGVVALTAGDAVSKLGLTGLGAHLNSVVSSVTALIDQMNQPIAQGGLSGVPGYQTQDKVNLDVAAMNLFLGSQTQADVVQAGGTAAFLRAGPQADTLIGGGSTNFMSGAGGNDTLTGGAVRDFLAGDEGDDTAFGLSGNDLINTQAGRDTVYGGAGQDFIMPGDGADTVIVDDDPDFISLFSSTNPSQVDGATDTVRLETTKGVSAGTMTVIVGFETGGGGVQDKLLFKESVFVSGSSGSKTLVGSASSSARFSVDSADFAGIVKIAEQTAPNFSDLGLKIATSITGFAANDAFLFLVADGSNTLVLAWDDRAAAGGNGDGRPDMAEFQQVAILVGITDTTFLDSGNLGVYP